MLALFYLVQECAGKGIRQADLDAIAIVLGVNREQAEAAFAENAAKGYIGGGGKDGGHA
jgi:hypothetical protein